MTFSSLLTAELSPTHLLKHPFYRAWSDGTLSRDTLRHYAGQYFHHVSAFPRYLSATHSQCPVLAIRQLLLENLMDEERGEENHPELWLRFAEALGTERAAMGELAPNSETRDLVATFLELSRSSFEDGLGALFAYEHQIPEIAKFKLDALALHYGIRDVKFFEVHREADVYHTEALARVLDGLPPASQERVRAAARLAGGKLWSFLDGVQNHATAA
jgi:pyrroloquinoline-quinone synthase